MVPPGIITLTTALAQSISVCIDTLDEGSEEQGENDENERITGMIEEGYGILMDLSPSCKFTNGVLSSLDRRLFPSEFDEEPPGLGLQPGALSTLNTVSRENVPQTLLLRDPGPRLTAQSKASAPGVGGGTSESSPLGDLLIGYSDLDAISPGQMLGTWSPNLSPASRPGGRAVASNR